MVPPRPTSTLFPYTTLFRSLGEHFSYRKNPSRIKYPCGSSARFSVRMVSISASVRLSFKYGRLRRPMPCSAEIEPAKSRSEEHTSELQSQFHLVCRLLLEKK